MMNGSSTVYSRLRNAIAPEWIASDSSAIFSFPTGCAFTYMKSAKEKKSPITPSQIAKSMFPTTFPCSLDYPLIIL